MMKIIKLNRTIIDEAWGMSQKSPIMVDPNPFIWPKMFNEEQVNIYF